MHDRFVIQRACRYANKNLHEKHPDWFDPTWVRRDDASDLSELVNARQEPCPVGPSLESHARMGVDLFLVRDQEDRKNSLQGKIVALVTYGVIYTFKGRVGIVTDAYLHPDDPDIASDVRECAMRHFTSIDVRHMSEAKIFASSHRPLKTDYSGLELAERCDAALLASTANNAQFVPLHPPSARSMSPRLPPSQSP